jgi:hypothetical protein
MAEDDKKKKKKKRKNRLGTGTAKEFRQTKRAAKRAGLTDFYEPDFSAIQDYLSGAGTKDSDTAEILELLKKQVSEGRTAEGGVTIDPQLQRVLDQQVSDIETAGSRSDEIRGSLDALGANVESVRSSSDAMIGELTDLYKRSRKEDERFTNVMKIMEAGLPGLNARENQALRETSMRQFQAQKQSRQNQINDSIARNQLRGGASVAAMRQLDRITNEAVKQAEQDLVLANIDIQDRRRAEYANTTLAGDAQRKANENAAAQTLAGATATANEQITNAEAIAAGALSDRENEEQRRKEEASNRLANTTSAAVDAAENRLTDRTGQLTGFSESVAGRLGEQELSALSLLTETESQKAAIGDARLASLVQLILGQQGVDIAKENQETARTLANR